MTSCAILANLYDTCQTLFGQHIFPFLLGFDHGLQLYVLLFPRHDSGKSLLLIDVNVCIEMNKYTSINYIALLCNKLSFI